MVQRPPALNQMNPAEVRAVVTVPLPARRRTTGNAGSTAGSAPPGNGRMTESLLDLLAGMLGSDQDPLRLRPARPSNVSEANP